MTTESIVSTQTCDIIEEEDPDFTMMRFLNEGLVDYGLKESVGRARLTLESIRGASQSRKGSLTPEGAATETISHSLIDSFFIIGPDKKDLMDKSAILKSAGNNWFAVSPKVLDQEKFSKYGESIQKYSFPNSSNAGVILVDLLLNQAFYESGGPICFPK